LPQWAIYDRDNSLIWIKATSSDIGKKQFVLSANDGKGAFAQEEFTIEIIKNSAPELLIPDNIMLSHGQEFILDLESSIADPDGHKFSYTVNETMPEWLTYDQMGNSIKGIPFKSDVGLSKIEILSEDEFGAKSNATITIEVKISTKNNAPVKGQVLEDVIVSESNPLNLNFSGAFFDYDEDQLTISVHSKSGDDLSSWIKFDEANATLTGKPDANGKAFEELIRAYYKHWKNCRK